MFRKVANTVFKSRAQRMPMFTVPRRQVSLLVNS